MPRILEAMRSGWKTSKASIFSPFEENLMGMPDTSLIDKAAPPLVSPSILVKIAPVACS